jgi:hypothetical protein
VWLLIVTLGFTLLVREDMGVYVASFGLYMLFCRPQRRWLGLGLIMAGIAWTSGLMLVWRPHSSYILNPFKGSAYSFSIQTALDLLGTLLSRSWNSLLATPGRSVALLQVFVALAGLPLLAAGDQLLWAPMMIFLIAVAPSYSGDLFAYRAAPLIPLLWGATANVLVRLRGRWAAAGIVMLLGTTLVGFRLWSPLPGGGRFDPSLYEVTEHDRIGQRLLAEIPPEASLAVQDGIGAHLTTRERVYLFPWFEPASPPQLIALDLVGSLTYPLDRDKIRSTVYTFRLDPAMQIVWEQDGYYLFHPVGTPQIPQQGPWVWAPWLRLEGYELSQMDREGAFRSKLDGALSGSELRVALYWTALTRMQINYVISVLLVAPDGFIVAQDDSWPGGGVLGTSAMEPRSTVRDIHYLHLPVGRGPEELRLRVIVYEADSLVRLAPEQGYILSTIPTAP